jgi:hypothetical protein
VHSHQLCFVEKRSLKNHKIFAVSEMCCI